MLIIIHGDNQAKSRDKLVNLIDRAKADQTEIFTLDAKKLELTALEEAVQSQSLFGQDRLVVIETLHSLPTSKRKKSLIEFVAQTSRQSGTPKIILWEKRKLTKTMLKKFPQAQVFEFNISQKLWQFLDLLGSPQTKPDQLLNLFNQVVEQEEVQFVFLMIARQVRLLIQAKEGQVTGAPFMVSKLKKQASYFKLDQLLKLHQQLFTIDKQIKTSTNLLDLKSTLDLFLISLYN